MSELRSGNGALDETVAGPKAPPASAGLTLPASAGVTLPASAKTTQPASRSGFVRSTVLPAPAAPGSAGERFAPLGQLGAGGMGEVLLVDDRDIARKVAIKRLRPDQRSEPALQRFAEEVRIVGQLEHPNIPPIHDVGVDQAGQHYFVMKYIEGETLDSVIDKLRAGDAAYLARFGYEQRLELFLGILHAMQYAHANGVIHRDIKPSNIMVGPYGEVTVMDWGLAKRVDEPERAPRGAVIGTPLYMAPEQAAGEHERVDVRADIFSLSLVFLELMTLTHPLRELSSPEAVIAQLRQSGVDNRGLKWKFAFCGAPCEYADVAAQGLEKDPERRFRSIDEMVARLKAARAGKFAVTCHITFSKRAFDEASRWIDRHPAAYTALFCAAIGAVGWGAVSAAMHLVHLFH